MPMIVNGWLLIVNVSANHGRVGTKCFLPSAIADHGNRRLLLYAHRPA